VSKAKRRAEVQGQVLEHFTEHDIPGEERLG